MIPSSYRLLIAMFVDGNPEELFGEVAELQEPPDAVACASLARIDDDVNISISMLFCFCLSFLCDFVWQRIVR